MSTASIIARLDSELEPKGFMRRKATWNREHSSLVEVIDIQISKGGDTVTLNAGVLSRPIHFICWGREAEAFVEEPFCTVRARVGQLMDDKDRWWAINGTRTPDEMAECLVACVLPFLDRMHSFKGMRDWLASGGAPSPKNPFQSICFAVLLSRLGNVDGGCKTLAVLEDKALGAWKARAREVATRIGCEQGNR